MRATERPQIMGIGERGWREMFADFTGARKAIRRLMILKGDVCPAEYLFAWGTVGSQSRREREANVCAGGQPSPCPPRLTPGVNGRQKLWREAFISRKWLNATHQRRPQPLNAVGCLEAKQSFGIEESLPLKGSGDGDGSFKSLVL